MTIYNAVATIRDDTAPTLSVDGPLLAGGWRRPGDELVVTASDATGISSVTASPGRHAGDAVQLHAAGAVRRTSTARLTVTGLADGAAGDQR